MSAPVPAPRVPAADARGSTLPRRLLELWLGAGLVVALVLWLCAPREAEKTAASSPKPARSAHAAEVARTRAAETRSMLQTLGQLALAARTAEPQPDATPRPDPPHPITADHRRLYRDVDLLHAADQAISEQRFAEARALLAQHHRELPGMSPIEEEGLWLLSDCAEQRSAQNVARVQAFYDQHTASSVRRRLRRACLEGED
jgi:hypothetical protein